MIHKVQGIVLWSRRSRDADKIVGIFSREKGRMTARATSAARAHAKFAALTEPFVESELAIYMGPDQAWGKLVGGRMVRSFPALRTQLARSTAASWVCEIIQRLTPEEQPSADEFELLREALSALETAEQFSVLRLAFLVRFLRIAGFSLENREAWAVVAREQPERAGALLEAPLENLGQLAWMDPAISALEQLASGVVADHLNRPLQVNRFRQMTGIQI